MPSTPSPPIPRRLIDAHIHLWPAAAAHPDAHAWMTPDGPLTRERSLGDYLAAVGADDKEAVHNDDNSSGSITAALRRGGIIYIETDRRTPLRCGDLAPSSPTAPAPSIPTDPTTILALTSCPLSELAFLRSLLEGPPAPSLPLRAVVPFAPLAAGPDVLRTYLAEAQRVAGPRLWRRVRGWRCLLQDVRTESGLRGVVVLGTAWREGMRILGERGWVFDAGVDVRGRGVWGVEVLAEMVEGLRAVGVGTGVVLNHLCKPDLANGLHTASQRDAFTRWSGALTRLAAHDRVYMKLSGGFSEMDPTEATARPAAHLLAAIRPWLDVVVRAFGPERIMFGSDWPVCTVRGPGAGDVDDAAWTRWREVVALALEVEEYGFSPAQKERVWFGTAVEAYGLDLGV